MNAWDIKDILRESIFRSMPFCMTGTEDQFNMLVKACRSTVAKILISDGSSIIATNQVELKRVLFDSKIFVRSVKFSTLTGNLPIPKVSESELLRALPLQLREEIVISDNRAFIASADAEFILL